MTEERSDMSSKMKKTLNHHLKKTKKQRMKGGLGKHYFITARSKAPHSTEKRFVFMWNQELMGFDFSKYNIIKAGGILTWDDIILVEEELKNCSLYETNNNNLISVISLSWLLYALYTGIMVYLILHDIKRELMIELGLGNLLVAFVAAVLTILAKKSFTQKLRRREKQFKKVINALNRTVLQTKDVFASVGQYGAYLVFELDFKTSIMDGIENMLGKGDKSLLFTQVDKNSVRGGATTRSMFTKNSGKNSKYASGSEYQNWDDSF